MSLGQSIQRFLAKSGLAKQNLSANLMINPSFEHTLPEGLVTIPTAANTFGYASGWFNFGVKSAGEILPPGSYATNPMTSVDDNGVRIRQYQDQLYGLCQQVFRGKSLSGRRIKVSGAYTIEAQDGSSKTGISVWLKSKKGNASATLPLDWHREDFGSGAPAVRYNVIELTGKVGVVQHIIRMTNAGVGETYNNHEEIFNRAFDWWDDGPFGINITAADAFIGLEGPSGDEGVLGYQNVKIWYLDEDFTDAGASGQVRVHSEVQAGTGTLHYFEEYFDVPSGLGGAGELFEDDDVWLVVMPCDPLTGVGSMGGNAEIAIWALSLQIVLEDVEAEDQILPIQLGEAAGPYNPAGLTKRYMLRYPMYRPSIYPLNSVPDIVVDAADAADFSGVSIEYTVNSNFQTRVVPPAGQRVSWCKQPTLPPGSVVTKARFQQVDNVGSIGAAKLMQRLSYTPTNEATGTWRTIDVVNFGTAITGSAEQTQEAHRNMTGVYWPESAAGTVIESDGKFAAADHWFKFDVANPNDQEVLGNFMEVLVDPRWYSGMWKK
jgi:hypothetical protein